jgi:hypothetical protein
MAKKKKEELDEKPKSTEAGGDADSLSRLMKLTKVIKSEKIKVAKKGPIRSANKWRSEDPKFVPTEEKRPKPDNTVEAGGMDVDPNLREEYENWRKDKLERENYRGGLIRRPEEPPKADENV